MKMGITVLNLSVLLLTLFPAYTIDAAASLTSANPGDKTRRTDAADAAASALTAGRSSSLLSRLPLDFIENRGQWDRDVKFMARKGSVAASFERAAIKLRLGKDRAALFSLAFEGASKRAQLVGEGKRDGHYNFFFGNDPAKWQSRVAAYSSVLYLGLYDRVDMRVREDSGRLEYDLILAAHADLEKIVIRVDGASGLEVAPDGSLLLKTAGGVFRQTPPLTWEELPTGERVPIPCHFRKVDARRYGFAAPRRDPARKLVIDPGLEWSTFLGGGGHEVVQGLALARDGSGDVILAGATTSPDFPAVGGALNAIGQAMYVTRLSAVGNSLVYSTLFGGSSVNLMIALALDASSAPVVVGSTHSTDFPTTAGAFDQTHNGEYDAFVTRFDSSGSRMVFSTLLGGSAVDEAWAVDLDGAGRVYVAGHTGSQNFPTTAGAYDTTPNALIDATFNSLQDVFVARLSETGTALAYSTYLGGQGVDYATDLAVDALGVVTLTGRTVPISSTAAPFPTTAGAVDRTLNGNDDAYIVRLRGAGAGASDLEYSTLLGGNDTDQATALALDPVKPELVTVVGWTYSGNFPVTPGALLPTHFAPTDTTLMFVTRFQFPATGGGSLVWSTYHGAPGNQQAEDVVVDDTGAAIVVGANSTRNPPTTERAFDRTPATSDGIISRISADGSQLLYSTLLGGTSFEGTMRVAYVGGATVVVAGRTRSTDFPVTPGALDTVYGADGRPSDFTVYDVFVSRMTLEPLATADMTAAPPSLVNPADGAAFTAPVFVTFDWADVADPSGVEAYHIQVSPNPTFTSDTVAQLSGWHETWVPVSQDETDFSTNFTGTFYWRVRTLDAAHNLSDWSATRAFTVGSPEPPPAPTLLSPANRSQLPPNTSIAFSWSAAPGATTYEIQMDDSDRFSAPLVVSVSGIAATQTVHSFSAQRRYWWRVRGRNVAGAGAWSAVRNFEIKKGAPPPSDSVTLSTLSLNPTSVTGGNSSQGTVTLTGAAPSGGAVVTLASSNTAVATVPASVTVAAGATSATFPVTTTSVTASTTVTISASFGGVTRTATLSVAPPSAGVTLSSLSLNPTSVTGGNSSQGTVTLTGAAPSGGVAVALSSSNAAVVTLPAGVTVPAGATSAAFPVTTGSVTASTSVTIFATHGGVTRTAALMVTAAATTDAVAIQRAEYALGNRELRVEATSTSASATLTVHVASTNELIGTLRNEGGGRYRGDFAWPSNPQAITVRSSLGGAATRAVEAR